MDDNRKSAAQLAVEEIVGKLSDREVVTLSMVMRLKERASQQDLKNRLGYETILPLFEEDGTIHHDALLHFLTLCEERISKMEVD